MEKKIPDTNHAAKRYRDEALSNFEAAKDSLKSMNLMLPVEYQVKITDDFWSTLVKLEESMSKFRDDHWRKEDE